MKCLSTLRDNEMIHMKNMLRKHGCTLKLFGSVTLAQIEEEENLPAENIHRPQRVKTWQDMPPSSTISYQSTGPDAKLDEVFTLPCPNFHSPCTQICFMASTENICFNLCIGVESFLRNGHSCRLQVQMQILSRT